MNTSRTRSSLPPIPSGWISHVGLPGAIVRQTSSRWARSPPLIVSAGGQLIQTTLGHPFWAPTIGRRMAKELEPGNRLLAIEHPVQVERILQAQDEVPSNLVEGPGNDFVGVDGPLVHDNTHHAARSLSDWRSGGLIHGLLAARLRLVSSKNPAELVCILARVT